MNCELCGKEAELYIISVEGTQLKACKKCSSMGQIIKKPEPPQPKKSKKEKKIIKPDTQAKTIVEAIVEDYAKKIRQAREKKGLTQKEFARKINEKESIIHKLETGNFEPPMALAKKLERLLHIKLVEKREEEEEKRLPKPGNTGKLTIGDIIKL